MEELVGEPDGQAVNVDPGPPEQPAEPTIGAVWGRVEAPTWSQVEVIRRGAGPEGQAVELPAPLARHIDVIRDRLGEIVRGVMPWDEVMAEVEVEFDAAVIGAAEAAEGPGDDEPDGEPTLGIGVRARARRSGAGSHWIDRMIAAQVAGSGEQQAPLSQLDKLAQAVEPELDARLDVPAAKPYGDDFYVQVAEVFRRLAPWVRLPDTPAKRIAEDNRVPVTTAHRWVKIARQRGHLEPGRRRKGG